MWNRWIRMVRGDLAGLRPLPMALVRLPWLVLGRFVTQPELWNRHRVVDVDEADLDPLADGHLLLGLRAAGVVGAHQVANEPDRHGLALEAPSPLHAALLVQLDQHDRVGQPLAERRLDGLS